VKRAFGCLALVFLGACHAGTSEQESRATGSGVSVTTAHRSGTKRRDGKGINQVWVTPGAFRMGTDQLSLDRILAQHPPKWVLGELPSEAPDHNVLISKGFWLDRTEVTNAAFDAFIKAGGYEDPAWWSVEGWKWRQAQTKLPNDCLPLVANHPRVCVTWYEAQAFAAWRGGRLPTEAEWEYAARGPDAKIYPWGDTFDSTRCNVVGTKAPEDVGSHPGGASWVGAEDMAGNAMEWVHDWLDVHYYEQEFTDDPRGPEKGSVKVEKGGWWGSNPFVARSAYRHFEDPPEYQDHHIGFRVVSDD